MKGDQFFYSRESKELHWVHSLIKSLIRYVYPFFTTSQPRRANTDYPLFSKITLKDHLVV